MRPLVLLCLLVLTVASFGCYRVPYYTDHTEEYENGVGGIVAYYSMDEEWEGLPGEVRDHSGNNAHGTSIGGAKTDDNGRFDRAGYFDGVDDVVNVGDHPSLDIYGSGLTMSAWIRIEEGTSHNMIMDK